MNLIFPNDMARREMKLIKCIILWAAVMALILEAHSQKESDSSVQWQHASGIYSSFAEFQDNSPGMPGHFTALSASEIKEYHEQGMPGGFPPGSGQFIWLGQFNEEGEFIRVPPDSIWAYAAGSEVFIRFDDHLVRLDPVGAICYFNTANTLAGKIDNGREYVFKYDEGRFRRFTRSGFLNMISDDLELYQQFLRLDSYRDMKESMPEFINKYNQRHPLVHSEN